MKNNLFKNFQNLFKKSDSSTENTETVNDESLYDDNSLIEDILGSEESEILMASYHQSSKALR